MGEEQLGLALSIMAAAVALAILYYGLARRKAMLKDLTSLEEGLESAEHILADAETPEEFYQEFERFDGQLSSVAVIGPYWRSFRRNLVKSDLRTVMGSPRPAGVTFNFDLLYSPDADLRRHEAIPNQLVGIGLFFTFLGLMLSLAIASTGLQGDVESAKQSLIALMSASAVKFVTSIAAIFAALVFTHSKNAKLTNIHPKIDQLADRIDTLAVPITQEQIAVDARREMGKQTILLETRNEELAKTIASELDATMQTSLKDAMAPIADQIGEMADKMGEISENTMRHMVEMFSKELGSAARDHSKRMAELLEAVSHAVEKVPEKIDLSTARFSEAMEKSASDVEQTFGSASRSLMKVLQDTSELMNSSSKGWAQVSTSLGKLTDKLTGTQDAFEKRLDGVHDATDATIEQLKAMASQMEKTTANLPAMDAVAEKLQAAASALEQSVSEIGKLEGISEEARRRALEASDHFSSTVSSIEREMKALDGSLAAVFSRTSDGLGLFQSQAEGIASAMDKQLAKAVDRLADAVQKVPAEAVERREAAE